MLFAAQNGHTSLVETLLQHEADMYLRDRVSGICVVFPTIIHPYQVWLVKHIVSEISIRMCMMCVMPHYNLRMEIASFLSPSHMTAFMNACRRSVRVKW